MIPENPIAPSSEPQQPTQQPIVQEPQEIATGSEGVDYSNAVTLQNTAFPGTNNIIGNEQLQQQQLQQQSGQFINNTPGPGMFNNNNNIFPNNNQSGAFQNTNNNNNGYVRFQQPQQQEDQRKSSFINVGWLYNKKLTSGVQLNNNEVTLLTVSYNVAFGNLRISFGNFEVSDLSHNYIKMPPFQQLSLATCNIYPEMAAEVLYELNNKTVETKTPLILIERIISSSSNWEPSPLHLYWDADNIYMMTTYKNSQYLFTLTGSQVMLFKSYLKFMIDGTAWFLTGNYIK